MKKPRRLLLLYPPLALALLGTVSWLVLHGSPDPDWHLVHEDFARIQSALDAWRASKANAWLPEDGDLSFLAPDFLPASPMDPWGRPYLYTSNGERVVLQSLGRDGERGGTGVDQDHTNFDGHR